MKINDTVIPSGPGKNKRVGQERYLTQNKQFQNTWSKVRIQLEHSGISNPYPQNMIKNVIKLYFTISTIDGSQPFIIKQALSSKKKKNYITSVFVC